LGASKLPKTYKVWVEGTFIKNEKDSNPYMFLQPNKGGYGKLGVTVKITDLKLERCKAKTTTADRTFNLRATFKLYTDPAAEGIERQATIACQVPAYELSAKGNYSVSIIDNNAS
jgi:hypothetical protein